ARLSPEKDHVTLLKGFQRLLSDRMDADLIIVGDGPLKKYLVQLAKDLKIDDKVKFLGFREDIPQILAAIDIFVLPSTMEGISLTLLEAMAAGKPVVTTFVGGNPE